MKKQMNQDAIKIQKEKIESRLLTVFATALGAEMLLLYLFNWFQNYSNLFNAARWACYILMAVFIGLGIFTVIRSSQFQKTEQIARSKKYMNWFYVCLAGFLSCLYIWPTEILSRVFRVDPMNLAGFNNFHPFFADSGVQFRIGLVMTLVAIYTVAAFIYYGVKSAALSKEKK